MSYLDTTFQWYEADIKKVKPKGTITLQQFIDAVISPKKSLLSTFKQIEEASLKGDLSLKAELKKGLFAVTPCVTVKGIRNYDSISSFNGLLVIEYDKIDHADILRDYIFDKFNSCIFAFLSPSKSGCKFIFNIGKVKSTDEFKELFFGLAYHLDKFTGLDLSGGNCVLPLFISYDPDAKIRYNSTEWTQRGYKEGSFFQKSLSTEVSDNVSEVDVKNCFSMITRMIDNIEDNGHPTLRSASIVAGGFSTYYGISQDELWGIIEDRIRDNSYLSKDVNNYLKTARTMFNKGLNSPIPLTNG